MQPTISRRRMLACAGAGLGLAAISASPAAAGEPAEEKPAAPFRYCLNTGTLRGHKLPLAEEAAIAGKAGYGGIEPWVEEIRRHTEQGGELADLKKRIADAGLTVESAIGFPAWAVDDDAQREKGLENMKREMDLVAQIGGRRIAAPPAGVNNNTGMDLRRIGERYRAVLELGRQMGVLPQLEIWGTAKTLGRVSEAAFVAIEANHPDACLLLDVYHIYRSGVGFGGLRLLNGRAMHVLHINDYPADPPREKATDADRVYPGDGIAPLPAILGDLFAAGFRGALSLELFNREYWKQEAAVVAKTGLEKIKAAVAKMKQ
jgi:sugar phosphate isomerase/epimerase